MVVGINSTGAFMCVQKGLKLMLQRESGSIINIASVAGVGGLIQTFWPRVTMSLQRAA
ncbi:MAG: SDR family NAD(P)-dependent oxidoreductase [Thermodesulfobacteriota bacterium]|nr:SDR family NAD(P)-dependent oxidoreductase [Thermodesulfobacteriota bacterium]